MYVSGKLAIYPSPNLTLTLTSRFGQIRTLFNLKFLSRHLIIKKSNDSNMVDQDHNGNFALAQFRLVSSQTIGV